MKHRLWIGLAVLGLALAAGSAPAQGKKYGPSAKDWDQMVDKAVKFLRSSQEPGGGWSTGKSPGVTGIVLTGLLKTGKVSPDDPMVVKGFGYVKSLVNPEAGHIAGKDPKVQLQNYVTSINVMALSEAGQADKYKSVIGDAVKFLKQLQWDDSESKGRESDFFGGAGYDSSSRPDLSNTQFFLDALKAAGVPESDPAYKKAAVFVSRCQNLKSEENDQPWAGKIDDGSFIYTPAGGGVTKVPDHPEGVLPGYGSMTYAGIKSLIYCGVGKDDPRIQKAYNWIQKNYTVEQNPGFPGDAGQWGLYYYYHTMAKALSVMGVDTVTDAKGVGHDWRADIAATLAQKQNADGSWSNPNPRWLEGDPNLATGYALMALGYCKPTGK